MPRARPTRFGRALTGAALLSTLAACGARVEHVPLDTPAERAVAAAPGPRRPPPPAPAAPAETLREEPLAEHAAAPSPTPLEAAGAASGAVVDAAPTPTPIALPGAPAGRYGFEPPSPLDSIGPQTPPNVAAATRLADAARRDLAAGNDSGALERLERAIAIDPNNPYAYYFLASLHLQTRSYDQAIAFADRAASLARRASPQWTSRAWTVQGNAYESAGRFADARQAYLRAVQAAPDNLPAMSGLARTGGPTAVVEP